MGIVKVSLILGLLFGLANCSTTIRMDHSVRTVKKDVIELSAWKLTYWSKKYQARSFHFINLVTEGKVIAKNVVWTVQPKR